MTMYASIPEFKAWLDDTPDYQVDADNNPRDPMLERLLTAASDAFVEDTGRIYHRETGAARTYYADPAGFVWVHDLISVTSIIIDANNDDTPETTLTTAQYRLMPKTVSASMASAD